jgi:WD40 repeat protein
MDELAHVHALRFSSDGRRWAAADIGGRVYLGRTETGKVDYSVTVPEMSARAMTFNTEGSRLVVGWAKKSSEQTSQTGSLTWWNTATGTEVGPIGKLNYLPTDLTVSPDGKSLVVCGLDRRVTVWDMESHESTKQEISLTGAARIVAFSKDPRILLTVRRDDAIQFWHWPTCRPVGNTFRGGQNLANVAFTVDGRIMVKGIWDGVPAIYEWPLPSFPAESPTIQQQTKLATGLEIVGENQVKPLTIKEWTTVAHSLKVGSDP